MFSSVENQSHNERKAESIYSTYSESEFLAANSNTQVPFVKFRPEFLDFKQQ